MTLKFSVYYCLLGLSGLLIAFTTGDCCAIPQTAQDTYAVPMAEEGQEDPTPTTPEISNTPSNDNAALPSSNHNRPALGFLQRVYLSGAPQDMNDMT